MAVKTFTTYKPEEDHFIELSDYEGVAHTFKLAPSIPGKMILDFMYVAGTEDATELSKAIKAVLDSAIVEEDKEAWSSFINEPKNGVTITVLSEVVGYVTEVLSGNPQAQE